MQKEQLQSELEKAKERIALLEKEREGYAKWLGDANEDWATIDTAVRKCAIQAGFSEFEVYGDSYGVPATEDIVELIKTKIKNLNTL